MKSCILILSILVLLGIIFSGCVSKPADITNNSTEEQPSEQALSAEDKEIDSLFEEELADLPEEDLTQLEDELS